MAEKLETKVMSTEQGSIIIPKDTRESFRIQFGDGVGDYYDLMIYNNRIDLFPIGEKIDVHIYEKKFNKLVTIRYPLRS